MNLESLKKINSLAYAEKWPEAANEALAIIGRPPTATNKRDSLPILRKLLQHLLDSDQYLEAATLQFGGDMFNAGPESVRRTFKAIEESSKVLLIGASSMGKCLSPETRVRMFDGSVKEAKDVLIGDRLMGDDSTPRMVLNTVKGRDKMYRITPERGDEWVCNSSHILTMRQSTTKICGGSGLPSKKTVRGN